MLKVLGDGFKVSRGSNCILFVPLLRKHYLQSSSLSTGRSQGAFNIDCKAALWEIFYHTPLHYTGHSIKCRTEYYNAAQDKVLQYPWLSARDKVLQYPWLSARAKDRGLLRRLDREEVTVLLAVLRQLRKRREPGEGEPPENRLQKHN
jgi:hypothetical protein